MPVRPRVYVRARALHSRADPRTHLLARDWRVRPLTLIVIGEGWTAISRLVRGLASIHRCVRGVVTFVVVVAFASLSHEL